MVKKRFQGKISSEYDLLPQCVPGYFELQESLAKWISKQFDSPTIIDIGLGTGITTQIILKKNPNSKVIGVDSEKIMVLQSKRNLKKEIDSGKVTIVQSDALDYLRTLELGSVDVIASSYTIHNCEDSYREKLVKEMFRVLRPGGMFINNDKYAVDNYEEYIKSLVEQICRYKILADAGREDLQYDWTKHEIEDQDPIRIMCVKKSVLQLKNKGFSGIKIVERVGQYAILVALKQKN